MCPKKAWRLRSCFCAMQEMTQLQSMGLTAKGAAHPDQSPVHGDKGAVPPPHQSTGAALWATGSGRPIQVCAKGMAAARGLLGRAAEGGPTEEAASGKAGSQPQQHVPQDSPPADVPSEAAAAGQAPSGKVEPGSPAAEEHTTVMQQQEVPASPAQEDVPMWATGSGRRVEVSEAQLAAARAQMEQHGTHTPWKRSLVPGAQPQPSSTGASSPTAAAHGNGSPADTAACASPQRKRPRRGAEADENDPATPNVQQVGLSPLP